MLNHPFNVLRHVNQRERMVRDPVSIATFIAPAIMASGGTAAFLLTTAVFVGMTAVTSWVTSALMPKPKSMTGTVVNSRDPTAFGDVVYGTVRKGGNITYMKGSGNADDNEKLYIALTLACHEVEEITTIYIDDKPVTVDGSGWVTSDPWNSKIRISKSLGTTTQTPVGWWTDNAGTTSAFQGKGIAHLLIELWWDQDVFPNGVPLFSALIKGKKVYDPRTSTTAYSPNAALCFRDYLTNDDYGVGAATSEIDDASFIVAANACDDNIPYKVSGSEMRYEINGFMSTGESPRSNLEKMSTACAGTLYWGQGQFRLKVGKWSSTVKTFTLDDFRSEINLSTKVPVRDNFNVVKGVFANKNSDYIAVDYPEFKSTTFITADGGQRNVLDLELPLTVTPQTAQRIAKLTLFRSREQMVIQARFSLKAFEVAPGDNVGLTISKYGWTNKAFEVVDWRLVIGSEGGETAVEMTLKETSSASYDWAAEEEDLTNNDTTLPDPRKGLTLSSLAATNVNYIDDDGRWHKTVELTWTVPQSKMVSYYIVQWKRASATRWNKTNSDDNEIVLDGLSANASYNFRVRAISLSGFRGTWSTLTHTVGRDTTAPDLPTGLSATTQVNGILLKWTNPTDADLKHVEIWENTANNSGTATRISRQSDQRHFIPGPAGTTKYYWWKSVDFSGNTSGFTAAVSSRATGIFYQNVFNLGSDPQGTYYYNGGWRFTNATKTSRVTLGTMLVKRVVGARTRFIGSFNLSGIGTDATVTVIIERRDSAGNWQRVKAFTDECGFKGRQRNVTFRMVDTDLTGTASSGITRTAYRVRAGKFNGTTELDKDPIIKNLSIEVSNFIPDRSA